MTFYGPDYGNISSGWYAITSEENYAPERDELNKVWNHEAEEVLRLYLTKYGTYFTAFEEEIADKIKERAGIDIKTCRYFIYYLANKCFELSDLRAIWLESHQSEVGKEYKCQFCGKSENGIASHPQIIAKHGLPPRYCRLCNHIASQCNPSWLDDLRARAHRLRESVDATRVCDVCEMPYSLCRPNYAIPSTDLSISRVSHDIFSYQQGRWGPLPPLLYPNLFAHICEKCFAQAFKDYSRGSEALQLKRLNELYLFLGCAPPSDFTGLLYRYCDRDSMLQLIKILRKVRTPEGYRKGFGSYFSALVKAGVYPEGTKRMSRGTMVVANDGHLCLSLIEKDIDDFLYEHSVPHDKEVTYPGTRWRADWEIVGAERRTFIEYFGLMASSDYAARAEAKRARSRELGIKLVELYPKPHWRTVLEPLLKDWTTNSG